MKVKFWSMVMIGFCLLVLSGCATQRSGTVSSTIVINAPVEEVFAWVADTDNVPVRLPGQTLSNISGEGLGRSYDYTAEGPMGLTASGHSLVAQWEPNELIVDVWFGEQFNGTTYYIFKDLGGRTEMMMVQEANGLAPFPLNLASNKRLRSMVKEATDKSLETIKAEIEK